MVHPDMFPKVALSNYVKPDEMNDDGKKDEVKDDVKSDARLVDVELDVGQ